MWRALFWSIGIYGLILGAECLVVDKVLLKKQEEVKGAVSVEKRQKELVPPDWAPWSLMSFGVVTLLYSVTLPQRVSD